MSSIVRNSVRVLALGFLVTHSVPAAEQSGNIRSIVRYTVKTDRTGDMAAAIKEYNAILQKAGWDKNMLLWRSMTGPTEMVLVTYHEKYAELENQRTRDPRFKEYQADMARIVARINNSFEHSERIIDVINPELSLPRSPEPPKMVLVWTGHVKEDKTREFLDLEKNEFLPAMKAAGVKSYSFARTRFGGVNNEFRSATGIDSWAAFDGENPVRKGMGDKYSAYVQKVTALLKDYRYEVYRFDPELSYMPSKMGATSSSR